jgi:Ca2+-binding EF-hand superfamily protein
MKYLDTKENSIEDSVIRVLMGEKLVGGQKKLDKDKDGDIDGKDFAMLRKAAAKKKKEMQGFNKAMNKIDKMFDGKFTFKTYRQALEGNSASDVNDWIKNYIELGGGVGRKVMDRIGI